MPLRINLWSGPRNVSTALMYSFAQRTDTRVVDEPIYAHYLRVSGAEHPGREEVLAAMESDGETVVRDVILGESDRPVVFFKQMAHHLVRIDHSFLAECANVLLIRDPAEVLTSIVRQIPQPKLDDIGIEKQHELFDELRALGQDPPVLDSRELLLDPEGVLTQLCARLGIPFDAAMLSWPAGPRPEDGVWAPHWYDNVHRSTGFAPYRPKSEPPPEHVSPVLEAARPHYEALYERALKAASGG
jgi:hypothetical protein